MSRSMISIFALGIFAASALAAPTGTTNEAVEVRNAAPYATGRCEVNVVRESWPGDKNTGTPYWLTVDILDNNKANIGHMDWSRCAQEDGAETCHVKSALENEMILKPITGGDVAKGTYRDYVQVNIGAASFGTDGGSLSAGNGAVQPGNIVCNRHNDRAGQNGGPAHTEWTCDFPCWSTSGVRSDGKSS